MRLTANPKGIAALWLRGHAPNCDESDIASLATLMEGIFADGVKAGLKRSRNVMAQSPTMSAATATLEADEADLIREYKEKSVKG